jgi:glycine C-acetyltransferase
MPTDRLKPLLKAELEDLMVSGRLKGAETVIRSVIPAKNGRGPRYLIRGGGETPYLRMNSNSYLGLSFHPEVIEAEDRAACELGTGPGAVRFISGTWSAHIALEQRLAQFHGREAGMVFSSAYATMMGVLPALVSDRTAVISDSLNHNCIINAIALARPREKRLYAHLAMDELEQHLKTVVGDCARAIIVTDGVFSMRGDHAPLDQIMQLAAAYDDHFEENVLVVVDDSHGVGAFGRTARGTEEVTTSSPADFLIGTLGKALGVNGGYVVADDVSIRYLREVSPFYVYSNPITPAEAAAAKAAVDIADSNRGMELLEHLCTMTARFRSGLARLGLEALPGLHPVVALMVRDTNRTSRLVAHLRANGILVTGLNFPVVPKGEEEIRFQIAADHTPGDIDEALASLSTFR